MLVEVLRLGHRLPRDERISTHVALVARAFGAAAMTYTGQSDSGLQESMKRICERWGGRFEVSHSKSAQSVIKQRRREGFTIVHLTMYGLPLDRALQDVRKAGKILLVVGSEHVPREIYDMADFNLSVTSQPHSEVAALAITLDRLSGGNGIEPRDFGGRISIVPSARGKSVSER